MYCVVDVLGFKQSSGVILLKEFAMIAVDGKAIKHLEFVVKAPYPFENLLKEYQAINSWITRNVHGIAWYSGTISYEESKPNIREILKEARIVYVNGAEKKNYLQSLLGYSVKVIDLMKLNCPSTMKLKKLLGNKYSDDPYEVGFASAGENVKLIRLWMLQNNVVPQSQKNFFRRLFSM
ncbi:GfV-B58-ORF1 [Ichnoviriform fumiferanae]|uniref:GfV-B58-ORF1 n=1 Tax=Ichnoviriform fumiferanae TaxID=419435 RepID=A2PZV4_9VIRU|nr:GfV-B58-ORF1 [Ichnoviriform fumiferanae]BAF45526.1 GfV-B58-ORF1 [Ichnoviriform fumiferanae]